MNRSWGWLVLAAGLGGCMGTEPDKPKPVLEALSTHGGAFGDTLASTRKQLDFVLRNSDASFVSVDVLKDIAISVSGTSVSLTHTCPSSLAEGESCFITVVYQPTIAGALDGQLRVASNAEQGTIAVGLSGTAVTALSPAQGALIFDGDTSTDFTAAVGTPRKRTYTLHNIGNAADTLTITGPTATDTGWTFTNHCSTTLAINTTCTLDVIYTPGATDTSVPAPIVVTDDYNKDYGKLILRPVGIGL